MADREHIVRYVAVLDTSGFWKEFQAHKEKLEKENKSAAKSTDKLTAAIENQTDSLGNLNDEMDDTEKKTNSVNNTVRKQVSYTKVLISALSEYRTGLKKGNKELLKSVTGMEDYSFNVALATGELKSLTLALEKNKDSLDPDVYRKLSKEVLELGKDFEAITGKVGFADAKSRNQSILAEAVKFHADRLKAEEDAQKELIEAEVAAHKEKDSREKEAFARLIEDAKQMNRIFNQNIKNELERRTAIEKQGYADSVDNFDAYLKTFKEKAKSMSEGGFFSVGDLSDSKKELDDFKKSVISFKDEFSRGDFKRITTSIESIETSFNKVGSARHDVDEVSSSVRDLDRDTEKHSGTMGRLQGFYDKVIKGARGLAGSFYQIKSAFLGFAAVGIAFALQSIVSALAALGGAAVVAVQALSQLAGVAAAIPGALFAIGAAAGALKLAFSGLGDAFKLFGKENGLEAPKTFAEALSRLHPAAKTVVQDLTGMNDKFQDMKKATQGAFFKPIEGSVKRLGTLFPVVTGVLTKAAGALGKVAKAGIEMVTSGPWKSSFKALGNSSAKVISSMGAGLLHLVDAFRKIAVAAMPLTEFLGKTFRSLAKDFSGWTDTLNTGSFDTVQTRVTQFISIIKNLGSVFASVFRAASDTTDWFMNKFVSATKRWKSSVDEASQAGGGLKGFFDDLKPVLTETSSLFSELFKGLAQRVQLPQLAEVISQLKTELLPALFDIFDAFSDPENISTFITSLSDLGEVFARALDAGLIGTITNTINLLAKIGEVLLFITDLPIVKQFTGIGASILSWASAGAIAIGVFLKLKGIFALGFGAAGKAAGAITALSTNLFDISGAGRGAANGLDDFGGAADRSSRKVSGLSRAINFLQTPMGMGVAAAALVAAAAFTYFQQKAKEAFEVRNVEQWSNALKNTVAGTEQVSVGLKKTYDISTATAAAMEKMFLNFGMLALPDFGGDRGGLVAQFDAITNRGFVQKIDAAKSAVLGFIGIGTGETSAFTAAKEDLEGFDKAISSLASSGNFDAAAEGLGIFAAEVERGGYSFEELMEKMPESASLIDRFGGSVESATRSLSELSAAQKQWNDLFSSWDAEEAAEKYKKDAKALKEHADALKDSKKGTKEYKDSEQQLLNTVKDRARAAQGRYSQAQNSPDADNDSIKRAGQALQEEMLATLRLIPATQKGAAERAKLNAAIAATPKIVDLGTLSKPIQDEIVKFGSLDEALTQLSSNGKGKKVAEILSGVGAAIPAGEMANFLATIPNFSARLDTLGLKWDEVSNSIQAVPDAKVTHLSVEDQQARLKLLGFKTIIDATGKPVVVPVSAPGAPATADQLRAVGTAKDGAGGPVDVPTTTNAGDTEAEIASAEEAAKSADGTPVDVPTSTNATETKDELQQITDLTPQVSEAIIKDVQAPNAAAVRAALEDVYVWGLKAGEDVHKKVTVEKVETGLPNKGGRIGSTKIPFVRRNSGGTIPGTGDEDTVPALLTPGEFVLPRKVVQAIGTERLEKLRTAGARAGDVIQKFKKGGVVGAFNSGKENSSDPKAFASGFMKSLQDKLKELKYNNKSEEGKRASDAREAGIESAKRLTEAQREQARAIYSNMIAQRDAARATEDLTKAAARRGLEEADAALSLKEAEANQKRVNRDASSTKLDRERAALAVTRAQNAKEDTAVESTRIREDLASLPQQQTFDQEDRNLELSSFEKEIAGLQASVSGANVKAVNSKIKKEIAKSKKKKRALGGSVGAGVPYITSELGEELFVPPVNGRILTANDTQNLMSMINLVPSMPGAIMADKSAKIESMRASSYSGQGTVTISNLNINNPVPERASDSIQKTLKKITSRQV